MRLTLAIVGLMVLYLALATGLALVFDRRFFVNDAIAAAFFLVLLAALPFMGTARPRGR
jgi:hypothetical protein